MLLMSLLLSVITLNPAMARRRRVSRMDTFKPAQSLRTALASPAPSVPHLQNFNRNGCFFNNFWNNSNGGTPLAIDITETGSNGSPVYIYWVNNTNTNIMITGKATANFYCPRLR